MEWVFLIYEVFWAFVVGLKAHFNLILLSFYLSNYDRIGNK